MDGMMGMIILWPVPWVPRGWMRCQGQELNIQQYAALYSLIGIYYGGDGRATFKLPDLRGKLPKGADSAQYGYNLAKTGGANQATVTLTQNNLPTHNHPLTGATASIPQTTLNMALKGSKGPGDRSVAQDNDYLGATTPVTGRNVNLYTADASNSVALSGVTGVLPATQASISGTVGNAGLGQPFAVNTENAYLALDYIICVEGLYPDRND